MSWFSGWTRAQQLVITVPSGTVAPLGYFPVVLTAASLPTELTNNTYGRSDGGDLAFAADLGLGNSASSIGAQIPCEVVSAVFGGSPSAEIHVQVPSVAATGTLTYIWVLYGNSGQTAQPAASSTYGSQKVWNENGTQNYNGIWHLQGTGTPSTWADSTSNGYTGTNAGATAISAGEFGGAASFNGTSAYIALGASTLYTFSTQSTLSAWGKTSSLHGSTLLSLQRSTGGSTAQSISASQNSSGVDQNNGIPGGRYRNAGAVITSGSVSIADGNWHYYVWIINGTNATLYVDNTSVATASDVNDSNTFTTSSGVANIGALAGTSGGAMWNGTIDEARIAAVARSASWIAAEFSNQSAPGTFIAPPGGQGPLWVNPYTYSAAGLAISGAPAGTTAGPSPRVAGLAISGAYGGSTAGPSPGAAGLAISGGYGGVAFPISSSAAGLAISGGYGTSTAGPSPQVSGLAISGGYGGAVFPGITSPAAGLGISGAPGTSTAGPSPGVSGLAISGGPGGTAETVTVLLAGLGFSGAPGGATGGLYVPPFYLPYEYTSVPIEAGNENPFDIDPEQTTVITVGLTSAD